MKKLKLDHSKESLKEVANIDTENLWQRVEEIVKKSKEVNKLSITFEELFNNFKRKELCYLCSILLKNEVNRQIEEKELEKEINRLERKIQETIKSFNIN